MALAVIRSLYVYVRLVETDATSHPAELRSLPVVYMKCCGPPFRTERRNNSYHCRSHLAQPDDLVRRVYIRVSSTRQHANVHTEQSNPKSKSLISSTSHCSARHSLDTQHECTRYDPCPACGEEEAGIWQSPKLSGAVPTPHEDQHPGVTAKLTVGDVMQPGKAVRLLVPLLLLAAKLQLHRFRLCCNVKRTVRCRKFGKNASRFISANLAVRSPKACMTAGLRSIISVLPIIVSKVVVLARCSAECRNMTYTIPCFDRHQKAKAATRLSLSSFRASRLHLLRRILDLYQAFLRLCRAMTRTAAALRWIA